jgi:hypothetical protein
MPHVNQMPWLEQNDPTAPTPLTLPELTAENVRLRAALAAAEQRLANIAHDVTANP